MIKSFNTPAMQARRAQAGITLIEVSIGLIIAAIIAAAAFIAFQNNARRTEIQDNTKLITEIVAETKQKFGTTVGYAGLTEELATQVGILQSPTQVNSYGSPITFTPDGTGDNVDLAWGGVEGDQCLDLVLTVADGLTTIANANGGTWSRVGDNAAPMDLTQAQTVCGANGDAIADLTFTFGRR